MLKFASTDKKIAILPEQFDTNKWVMNCENGTVDLKSGELNEHYTWDYITKLAPIEFNLNARCPRWRAFISQIMDGDSESIEHLQRVVGYALSGVTEEKCLFLLLGPTDSGKTTFIETLRHVLGDYAKATEFKTFLYSKYGGSTVRNDIARLEGARFVSATEAARDQEFDQPIVKIITGGDTMVARFLYKEFTEYEPEFKVFLATNHPPKVSIADDAIMNRIHVIPFDVSILKKEQERNLKEKLIEERNGILAWAVKGCLKWQEDRNLKPSRKAKAAIKRYRADADVIWKFIDERCYRFKNNYTPFTALWVEWQEWCNDNYVDQGSIKGFAQDLERHGYKAVRKRIDGVQHWVRKGLLLKSEVSEQLERRVGESLDSK
jgi:putative DNA primase/helicase